VEEVMRYPALVALVSLASLVALPAAGPAADPTEVKPVVCWYPAPEYTASAVPKRSVQVMGSAAEFTKFWKRVFPKEMVPEVNFDDHFVVIVTQVLGYNFSKLVIDDRGDGTLPKGVFHNRYQDDRNSIAVGASIAVFPRGKVKSVDGQKLPAAK
jgi:hypothetical protein